VKCKVEARRNKKSKMDAGKLAFEQANKQALYIIQKILYNTSNCGRTTRPSVSIQMIPGSEKQAV
jgi:hypothetical protein